MYVKPSGTGDCDAGHGSSRGNNSQFHCGHGGAATGVSVVTTEGLAGRFGLTVSAISSVSAEPPMLLACVNRKSPAVAAIDRNGRFAVNVLGLNSKDVAEVFAGRPKDGKPYDFERHGWEEGATGHAGSHRCDGKF